MSAIAAEVVEDVVANDGVVTHARDGTMQALRLMPEPEMLARETRTAGPSVIEKTVSYTEPTTVNASAICTQGGAALTNLRHTTIFYKVGNPSTPPPCRRRHTATDANGVESSPSCSDRFP
jgi:hypothetical protein